MGNPVPNSHSVGSVTSQEYYEECSELDSSMNVLVVF